MAQLPHELIDAILEDVLDSSLVACSLTARAFVPVSQRRLFRWMTLSNIAAYERTARLLASSPHLWQHFRFLAIDIKQNPCLIDFLSLPSIKCFALAGLRGVPASLISRVFNSSFKEVFFSSLLILDAVEPEELSPPTDLWKFTISADQYLSMLPFMLHSKRMPTLEHLSLELERSLALPALPALRSLELMLDTELAKSPTRLHTVIADTIAALPCLETLALAFLDRPRAPNGLATGHTPHLRSVQVSLRYFRLEPERYAAFVPFMQSQLPRAFDAGLIAFSYLPFLVHAMDTFAVES
ncbi:hypothetical protein B0H11DRAFT_2047616 [Mycena galericulata]|nr:hypothetical protein B0H11DRAFT_2047616 [Mycena galericulata]